MWSVLADHWDLVVAANRFSRLLVHDWKFHVVSTIFSDSGTPDQCFGTRTQSGVLGAEGKEQQGIGYNFTVGPHQKSTQKFSLYPGFVLAE